mmetsp:Transcript_10604/g.18622  ORF Transcript_10604/g.18622 Transcript_10604/m.18622 type:complete len:199 (-) Transcript_10604:66-662(-)|eukprot:CAMPEP_0183751118 /NCGR_PEP_ID=MMETSP0739-20130205/1560_1 /TAXON_ID=385413 /ORGANISM="Thalassiosira miniscula, Strain CCMP1093" /LENGTH=198 /DNA_ID=CAMNT_0025987313 /DNA_START=586 /DNA_END=1182 /DNA_ORIENTATION=+
MTEEVRLEFIDGGKKDEFIGGDCSIPTNEFASAALVEFTNRSSADDILLDIGSKDALLDINALELRKAVELNSKVSIDDALVDWTSDVLFDRPSMFEALLSTDSKDDKLLDSSALALRSAVEFAGNVSINDALLDWTADELLDRCRSSIDDILFETISKDDALFDGNALELRNEIEFSDVSLPSELGSTGVTLEKFAS